MLKTLDFLNDPFLFETLLKGRTLLKKGKPDSTVSQHTYKLSTLYILHMYLIDKCILHRAVGVQCPLGGPTFERKDLWALRTLSSIFPIKK